MMNINTETGIISATGACFIIPNRGGKIEDFMTGFQKELDERMQHISALNGQTFNRHHDWIAQIWWVSKDLESDNLTDHGFRVIDENGVQWFGRTPSDHFPVKVFGDHKEGDEMEITYPITLSSHQHGEKEVLLKLNVKLAQKDYRYRNFGDFEKVLKKVTS